MNIKEIIEAWIIAGHPSDVQRTLADERGKICEGCSYKKPLIENIKIGYICSACGCPISKKIFTNSFNPCPEKKWDKVDEVYFKENKTKKTIV